MNMNGNDLVVKDWDNLSDISTDKLIKVRDVVGDRLVEVWNEYLELRNTVNAIDIELSKRH